MPNNTLIYSSSIPMIIECITEPIEVLTLKWIDGVYLNADNQERISERKMWLKGNAMRVCYLCTQEVLKSLHRCYTRYDQRISLKIVPDDVTIYSPFVPMTIECKVTPPDLEINRLVSGIILESPAYYRISPLELWLNGTADLACFNCSIPMMLNTSKCYRKYDVKINLEIQPNYTTIYFVGKIMTITCEVDPADVITSNQIPNIDFIFHNASFTQKLIRKIVIKGAKQGKICFICGHAVTGFKTRCYDEYELNIVLTILPNDISVYFPTDPMIIECTTNPPDIISTNMLQGIVLNCNTTQTRISDLKIRFVGTLSKECFTCTHPMLNFVQQCYSRYEQDITVRILPNDTEIYIQNVILKITCIVKPDDVISNNLIKGIDFTFDNSTATKKTVREITIDGRNSGTICFTCGHKLLTNDTRCYKYYGQRVTLNVLPSNTYIYLPSTPMLIECVVSPAEVVTNNLLPGIRLYSDTNQRRVSDLTILLHGTAQNECFECRHAILQTGRRCYIRFDEPITIEIQPNYSRIYIKDRRMTIECTVDPASVLGHSLIKGIDFTFDNSSAVERKVREVIIDGRNSGLICFTCGHIILINKTRCYNYYDSPVSLEIIPTDIKIYFISMPMVIECVSYPRDVIEGDLVTIELISVNNYSRISNVKLWLNGSVEMACFQCNCAIIQNVTRCYQLFEDVTITIQPNYTNVYFPNRSMIIVCSVNPTKVITNDLISGIDYTFNNSTFNKTQPREVVISGQNVGYICFVCDQKYLRKDTRCYKYSDLHITLNILPNDTKIYLPAVPMVITCIVTPQDVIDQSILLNILLDSPQFWLPRISDLQMLLNGTEAKVCFTCSHPLLVSDNRCYIRFDKPFVLDIQPDYTKIYLPNQTLVITCVVKPPEIITSDLISGIKFTVDQPSLIQTDIRQFTITGVNIGKICFTCYHHMATNNTHCYEYYDKPITLDIIPNDTKIYQSSSPFPVKCKVTPDSIIDAQLITNIRIDSPYYARMSNITMWLNGTRPDACFTCSQIMLVNATRCYRLYDKPITLEIFPIHTSIYMRNKRMNITCVSFPGEVIDLNLISGIDFTFNNSTFTQLIPREVIIDGSNKSRICFICSHWLIRAVTRCYDYFGYDLTLNILPNNTKIYLPKNPMVIECEVKPRSNNTIITGILLDSAGYTRLTNEKMWLNGSVEEACFMCTQEMLDNVTRCYRRYDQNIVIEIHPNNTLVYLPNKQMTIKCVVDPDEIITNDLITDIAFTYNNSTFTASKTLEVVIPGRNLGRICFVCGNRMLTNKIRCYDYFNMPVTLHIYPNDTKIYFLNFPMIIYCVTNPLNASSLILQITLNSLNQTRISNLQMWLNVSENNACFTCLHSLLENVTRCYRRYDETVQLEIIPSNTKIYLSNKRMAIVCIIKPPDIINKDLISGIDYTFNNSTFNQTKVREVVITGKNVNKICFVCDHRILQAAMRCYDYYFRTIVLKINPIDTKIYFTKYPMIVDCKVTPDSILDDGLIDDILLNSSTYDYPRLSNLSLFLNGSEARACFTCTHMLLDNVSKCYDRFDGDVEFDVLPNDRTIYLPQKTVTVTCVVSPESLIKQNLIYGIDFTFNNSTYPMDRMRIVITTGRNVGTMCFKCGHFLIGAKLRCYKYYDIEISIIIWPNDTTIYLPNVRMDIICGVIPEAIVNDSLIQNIRFFENNSTYPLVNDREITTNGRNVGQMVVKCGHNMLKRNGTAVYNYYDKPITLMIHPNYSKIYIANRKMNVSCVSDPSEVIDKNLIQGIELHCNTCIIASRALRWIEISPDNRELLCFTCNHRMLTEVRRCFKYYDLPIKIIITPVEVSIYLPNIKMDVQCNITPKVVVDSDWISNVVFSFANATGSKLSPTYIQIDGSDNSTICFICGSPIIGYEQKCYEYYDKNISVVIIPDDTNVYFTDIFINYFCQFTPADIGNYIKDLKIHCDYPASRYLSNLHVFIHSVSLPYPVMRVTCSGKILPTIEKLFYPIYNYSLEIHPANVDIYLVYHVTEAKCVAFPKNLTIVIPNIDFVKVSAAYTKISKRHIKFGPFSDSPGTICLKCGHYIMLNVTKCYSPYIYSVTISISPNQPMIYSRYNNSIWCEYHPLYIQPSEVPFILTGINRASYSYNHYMSISISTHQTGSHIDCAICGMTVIMNTSRCYNVTDEVVILEIVPAVDFYLIYELKQDIICQTHPIEAMTQFSSISFTDITPTNNYDSISPRHVKICLIRCTMERFCFVCHDSDLTQVRKCYFPYDKNPTICISPNTSFLNYMSSHDIQCIYDPYFTTYDKFSFRAKSLPTSDYNRANMSIFIKRDIKLLNRYECFNCSQINAVFSSERCYNLTADVVMMHAPFYLIYLVTYFSFDVHVFFKLENQEYNATCKQTYFPAIVIIQGSIIKLPSHIVSGDYQFQCNLPLTNNYYPLTLTVFNKVIIGQILPISSSVYFMAKPNFTCIYFPVFVAYDKVSFDVTSGLRIGDTSKVDNVISVKQNIIFTGRQVCLRCNYTTIFTYTKCYLLQANISFHYNPSLKSYLTKYREYGIKAYYQIDNPIMNFSCQCRKVGGPNYRVPYVKDAYIFLNYSLTNTGNYTYNCSIPNSDISRIIVLQVYTHDLNLDIYPVNNKITMLDIYARLTCSLIPNFLYIEDIKFNTEERFELDNFGNGTILVEVALAIFHRCMCFTCSIMQNLISAFKCYYFKVILEFDFFPKQNIYFSWSNMSIYAFFVNPYKPERSYHSICAINPSRPNNFTYEHGYIILNKNVRNGTYTFRCGIYQIKLFDSFTIDVFEDTVYLFITPNGSSVYLTIDVMEVKCTVIPPTVLSYLPSIRFTHINSTDFDFIDNRTIMMGGPRHTSNDIICVTCGDLQLPFNASKCFSPYDGPINMSITPNVYELPFQSSHKITCRFTPIFINYSLVAFRLVGIPQGLYKLSNDLVITIEIDKTITNRNICVVCGDRPSMNISRCYYLGVPIENNAYIYVTIVFVLLLLIFIILYIQNFEIM